MLPSFALEGNLGQSWYYNEMLTDGVLSLFPYTTMATPTLVLLYHCDTGGPWEPGGAAK